jgi:hypothetical protein
MENTNLNARITAAIERVRSTLQGQAPFLSREVGRWMREISPDGDPSAHFTHLRMFPILQMPEWLVETLPIKPDLEFQQSLFNSSVNGYYYIRLIDDVMDGDRRRSLELSILPAAGFFCSQFQSFYQAHFPQQHEFWRMFLELWTASCESAAHDSSLRSVDWSEFEKVSSRKYSAAGIPVAAACYYYNCTELMTPWLEFTNDLARWSQMLDDLLDWYGDRHDQRATYFLSEGERRKRAGESVDQWVAREGCMWGFCLLEQWMSALHSRARELGSTSLKAYLGQREVWLLQQKSEMLKGFAAISQLASILEQVSLLSDAVPVEERVPG